MRNEQTPGAATAAAPAPAAPAPAAPAAAAPATAPAAPAATASGAAVVIEDNDATPPPPQAALVASASRKWAEDFMSADPLTKGTGWGAIGPYIVLGFIGAALLGLVLMCLLGGFTEQEETDVDMPENMYGEVMTSLVTSTAKMGRDGVSVVHLCELGSSLVLLGITYLAVLKLIAVAQATIGNVDADVLERDSLFAKFRDPVAWLNQDWEHFPDTSWRRKSMVWFCHDIIYGKTKHVNELGPDWDEFSFVVLFIWFAHMLNELREGLNLAHVTWSVPSVAAAAQVEEDKEKVVVTGMAPLVKLLIYALVILPKLALNVFVGYIGAVFLMYNDLDDDLQEILLKTIEMAFILEMDELIYAAFVSQSKKDRLSKVELPALPMTGCTRIFSRYGDFPRLVLILAIASYLCLLMHTEARAQAALTPKQVGVIEGCCNFMEYLKGAGHKSPLVDGNPCVAFRETYEMPMGLPVYVANATAG